MVDPVEGYLSLALTDEIRLLLYHTMFSSVEVQKFRDAGVPLPKAAGPCSTLKTFPFSR